MPGEQHKLVFNKDPFRQEDDKNAYNLPVAPNAVVPKPHKLLGDKFDFLHKDQEEDSEPRSVKDVLKDAGRQIVASIIILIIGFLALNWSAYYQIAQSKWAEYTGANLQVDQTMEHLADTTTPTANGALQTSGDVDIQKHQIPQLDLEVMPIDNRLVIPRIKQNIPIVKVSSKNLINHDWNALEKEMQDALREGVIHYPGTSFPGQHGNAVITGHSSYFPWDLGRFKDVFALLHQMKVGDRIITYYDQEKYIYEVTEIKVVLPTNVDVLKQTTDDRLTLITCTPVGTNLKRLIVIAKPIKASAKKTDAPAQNALPTEIK